MKKKIFVLALLPLLLASCGGGKQSTQQSRNSKVVSSTNKISSIKPGEALPYDIDKTGCINRFYANEKNSKDVYIPATYSISTDGKIVSGSTYQVKTISAYCFANNNLLETVYIPDTVTKIENNAFENCSNLQMITVSSSVSSIGEKAFYNCPKLQNIAGSNHSNSIVLEENDHLRTFSIPDSVTALVSGAFSNWDNLYELELGTNITRIEQRCLKNCPELFRVTVKGIIEEYGLEILADCPKLNYLTFQQKGQKIRSIVFPDSVTALSDQQFYDWELLEEVFIGANTAMKQNIFHNNKKLKKIVCPNTTVLTLFYSSYNADDIGGSEFYSSQKGSSYDARYYEIPKSLVEVQLLNGTTVEQNCFLGMSSIQSIVLPSTIKSFSSGSFCGLKNIQTVYFRTDCSWTYDSSYTDDYGTINQSTMNTPSALASMIKSHFANTYYHWWANNY